jgi:hypothetical protein
MEDGNQGEKEEDFVELGGVARDAVAEVDGPGECRGRAVGVVGEAGEEAPDAADGDAEGEGNGVEVAGGGAESDVTFREFDADEAEGESTDDGFASDQVGGVVQAVQGELRIFEPEQEFGADGRSGYGGGDDGPAERGGDWVGEAAAEGEVNDGCDDVGERFKEEMGMEGVGAEVEIVRESGCGMG